MTTITRSSIEVKKQGMNRNLARLSQQGIEVVSMRNKVNRSRSCFHAPRRETRAPRRGAR